MDNQQLIVILFSIQVFANAQTWEYYKGSYFLFSSQTANYNDAKSACIGQGGHLAIISDVETQAFIKNTGSAYKNKGKWMASNFEAYIDAVKTTDGTGWEWNTTGVKFYFKSTQRGSGGPFINNGQYNSWHIYQPSGVGDKAVVQSAFGGNEVWNWQAVSSSTVAHYICQIEAWEYYKGSYFLFSPRTANYNGAKSACIGQGGHLASIPDVDTQAFIKNTGSAYKTEGKWMASITNAYIDAVKTSDGTGWEWSTTGVKFYFKTTQRGIGGTFIENGQYNNWHIYEPSGSGQNNAVMRSYDWHWLSVSSSTVAHYICQVKVKSTKLVVSNMTLNVKYGADYVDCNPDLHPGPPVSWMRNPQPISTNTNDRVYQTITKAFLHNNSGARLYLTRGLAQDSGVYTCNATSSDQSAATTLTIDRKPRVYATKLTTSSYTCKFIGDSTPSVHWNINDITISKEMPFITTTMLNEHEVSSEISNLLIFGSQDVVSCWASNSYGSSEMTSQSAFPDTPSISGIVSLGACPGSQLQVNWTDLTKTNGNITYSISVNASGQTLIKYFNQTSTSDNKYTTTLNNLMPRTSYAIKIHLFYSKKAEQLLFSTAGVKPSITSAILSLGSDNTSCLISWTGGTAGIIGAKITVSTSVYRTAEGIMHGINQTNYETSNFSYTFPTKANRQHNITVAAKTCSEVGLAVVATGQCITPVQAPSYIATPTVEGGSAQISYLTISKPDESNGPISCYVVIGYTGSSVDITNYPWLQITKITTNNDPSIYCVATLPRFNEARKQVKLSSSDTTQCSLGSSDVIKCTNKPMTNGLTYKFQVVSITSSDGVYSTQTSLPVVTTAIEPQAESNSSTIAIAVVSVFLVLVLIAAGYMYWKRRNSSKTRFKSEGRGIAQHIETDEDVYVNMAIEQNPELDIPASNLVKKYKSMLVLKEVAFKKQFEDLAVATQEVKLPTTLGAMPDNKKKNRYKNILPYDSTRVVLRKSAEQSDYINANFIDGYSQLHKFIATQGPLTRTSEDFWRMVWEQESLIIVMLANVMEGGKAKCAKYWPEVGKSCTYGGYNVETVEEKNYGFYVLRTIHMEESGNEYASVLRKIQHFQYIRWPDHGVPLITSSLIRMHNKVIAEYEDLVKDKAFPIIVHCSAGAGRTGAYIGFDILHDEMQSKNQVNVYRTVLNMRKQRMDMVQNMKQYVLLHKLLSECHALGSTTFKPSELNKRIAQHTILLKEFDNLNLILPMTTSQKIALQHSNKPVNKDVNILPYDHSAVFIATRNDEEDAPYLNASFISEYMVNESTIVAQDPLPINIGVFWRAVVDNNVNIIVMLSQPGNGETQDTCLPYYPHENGSNEKYGEISVTQIEECTEQGYVQRKLQVVYGEENVTITHLQCLFWKKSLKPDDMRNLLNLIAVVGHLRTEHGSVLIHCCDGAGRSGVFCALNNLIQRLRAEDEIDVFRTVKDLRDMRPQMVRSFDNYMTCYKGLAEFRSSFDTYANV